MPDINRIRVNNVKYNFGTQSYDDFTMRLYGQNTLYDLANGGGKSVLMLLLMQCMIPNCTLDEKQPLEKLFRDTNNNGTIHSLIEWRLDPQDIVDGFRYMTTGFCARKARDRGEEAERDVASVEYFNYCIFYQGYGKHDIVNLPLSDSEGHITYQALKNYLHDLSRRENMLKVFVFDRKGEYQRFISRYGIIESQWEIVRGINKTEGHVRTYFETNYRTTRKVVEDLLIEEIIEKAYMTKTGQEEQREDSAAALLMNIREQLRVLAEKKKDIRTYDLEAELVGLLSDRIRSFGGLYGEREEIDRGIAGIYLSLDSRNARQEKELEKLSAAVDQAEAETDQARARAELLKTAALQAELKEKDSAVKEKEERLKREEDLLAEEGKGISRRRAELDYLLLQEEEQKRKALLAEENADTPEEIAPVIAGLKAYYDAEIKELEVKLEDGREKLRRSEESREESGKVLTDARIELAVLTHEETALTVERTDISDQRKTLLEKLSEQSLNPVEVRLEQAREEQDRLEEMILGLQQQIAFSEEETLSREREVRELEQKLAVIEEQLELTNRIRELRDSRQDRIREIGKIYGAEEQGDTLPEKEIRDAVYRKLSRDLVRLSELERSLVQLEKRREEVREGRWLEMSRGAEEILSYISTRHGVMAMFGMDYLAQLPGQERTHLLEQCPELPYGIVVRDYEKLLEDTVLQSMETHGSLIRIYDRDRLNSLTREVADEFFTVRHSEAFFLSEDTEKSLVQSLADAAANQRTERDYLQDAVETERKDLEFLMLVPVQESQEVSEEEVEELRLAVSRGQNALKEERRGRFLLEQSLAEQEAERDRLSRDAEIYQKLLLLDQEEKEVKTELAELVRRKTNLSGGIGNRETLDRQAQDQAEELSRSLKKLEETLTVLKVTWQEQYAPYLSEISDSEAGQRPSKSKEELEAAFRLWKQGHDAAEEVLRQRRLLREASESAILRLKQNISERRVELSELQEAYEAGQILPGDAESLRRREDQYLEKQAELKKLRELLADETKEVQRLEGSIAYAVENYENAFGAYTGFDGDSEELSRELDAAEELRKLSKEKLQNARDTLKAFQKQSQEFSGLYREAGRLVERNRIDLSVAEVREDTEGLQQEFDDLLLRLDRNDKNLERARSQMLRTKGQVTQSLMDMGAASLSVSIRDDAELPGNKTDAELLDKRLQEMAELIRVERSRVEQGLSDMENLKENFVEQCLERCLDVRTELDKLPQLSQIRLGEEMVQMVKLTIPYVKDEFLRQRMADYIDRIVSEADEKKSEEEQFRYLRTELALKKLFSVIVTDMNAVRLQLYKRERISAQSRYLRYEEAVGSTGQSQGIYIQFLISVINYIAGMYSMQDADRRKKTIFIDNPFGAAKDIYIWEPIFALLSANHVQLIVPSRGATPEITGRFDVNYVLGQQMSEGHAVTVVTRYSSRSREELTEYKELDYEQATFDFI